MRSSIAGGWCGLRGSAGHPGPQERPHHDPLQCSGDRQSRCGGEADSRLTRKSRENRSKVGSVMCKSLKRVGGKGGTRTLDPGIMRSFYYGSAGQDGVAAIWAPKSTVGHRRITRNSRALVQPGEVFLAVVQRPAECREPRQLHHRIKSRASCSVRRGGALRHSAQHVGLVSLIYIQACGGPRDGEPPGVSHCTE